MIEVYAAGVDSGETKNFSVELQVPQITMHSNGRFCNIVEISYELKVEAEISGCHQNVTMIFPITIGSVPLNFGASVPFYTQPEMLQGPAFSPVPTYPSAPYYPPAPDVPDALIQENGKFIFQRRRWSSEFYSCSSSFVQRSCENGKRGIHRPKSAAWKHRLGSYALCSNGKVKSTTKRSYIALQ